MIAGAEALCRHLIGKVSYGADGREKPDREMNGVFLFYCTYITFMIIIIIITCCLSLFILCLWFSPGTTASSNTKTSHVYDFFYY
jgi:hypothetical protein